MASFTLCKLPLASKVDHFARADLANTAKKKDVRDRASAFWNALEPISDEFNKIESVQLAGALVYRTKQLK